MAPDRRIIWLRAVNVGGAKLPMAELRSMLADLGASEVETYIQSGNIVCACPEAPEVFDRRLEQAIEARYGYFREAISRTPEEVRAARTAHPFEVLDPRWSHISFLPSAPTADAVAKARDFETGDDRWEVIGREWHLRYVAGAGRPEMDAVKIGRALGVPNTARNLNTVDQVIALAAR